MQGSAVAIILSILLFVALGVIPLTAGVVLFFVHKLFLLHLDHAEASMTVGGEPVDLIKLKLQISVDRSRAEQEREAHDRRRREEIEQMEAMGPGNGTSVGVMGD